MLAENYTSYNFISFRNSRTKMSNRPVRLRSLCCALLRKYHTAPYIPEDRLPIAVKFLHFVTPENFAHGNQPKIHTKSPNLMAFWQKTQMEYQTVKTLIRLLLKALFAKTAYQSEKLGSLGSDHLIFMGGGGGSKMFRKKNPGPNFPEKISRTGKVLLITLYHLQISAMQHAHRICQFFDSSLFWSRFARHGLKMRAICLVLGFFRKQYCISHRSIFINIITILFVN